MNKDQFGLPAHTLETINTLLTGFPGIKSALIYGSRAKGNYRNGSDIDITLITDGTFTHLELLNLRSRFDDSDMPYMVDVSIFNELRNENLKAHIQRVGKALYERTSEAVSR
jgi:predicted nucleotidyltransferase